MPQSSVYLLHSIAKLLSVNIRNGSPQAGSQGKIYIYGSFLV